MPKGDRDILKADPEDGTTPIANLLLEALAIVPLSGVEKGAVLALWRVTYGWTNGKDKRKTEETISSEGWAKMLNTSPAYAARVVRDLVDKNVLIQKDIGQGMGYIYSMNTRVNQWVNGVLNGKGLTERYSLPLTKRYRVHPTKRYRVPATNLALLNKEPKKDIKESNIDNDNRVPEFAQKLGYTAADLPTLEEAEYLLKRGNLMKRNRERLKKLVLGYKYG